MTPHGISSTESPAAERGRLQAENDRLRQALRDRQRLYPLAGSSRAIRDVRDQIAQLAHSTAPVLVRGEPGVGRGRAARALHGGSARAALSFLTMSCAIVPDDDAASQFAALKRGEGGTILLQEVAALGPGGQDLLLAVLREPMRRERLIASTSAPLERLVEMGAFNSDLLRLLEAVTLRIPPLREHKADLPVLVDLFIERSARDHVRRVSGISARAMDMMRHYDWPGNISELRRAIEHAVVLTTGSVIHHHHLPDAVQEAGVAEFGPLGLNEALEVYERDLLEDALRRTRGVRSDAARLLLTSERVLNYRLRKHAIDSRRFRAAG